MSFKDYVDAVAKTAIEFPQLKAAMLAQSIMESGRQDTELAKQHNNFHGMKFRPEMQGFATKVYYKTDSEPTGGADFCKFESKEAEVKGYWHFLTRSPYAGWKDHAQNASSFLAFICPIWCPAGYTAEWKNAHGGLSYHQYVLAKLLPEAEQLLNAASPDSEAETITKIMLNRKDDGTPVATAYAGDTARWTRVFADSSLLAFNEWVEHFPNAKLISVADTTKAFPKLPDYGVEPVPEKPTEIVVVLDSGHSLHAPGARSNSGTVREEILNEHAIAIIADILKAKGIGYTWPNPDPDNLTEVGKVGWGKPKIMVSFHHNKYDGNGNPYVCCMVSPSASQRTKLFAQKVSRAIAHSLKGTPQETKVFEGTSGMEGVYEAGLTVTGTSAKDPDGKPPEHILIEAYFLNKFTDESQCKQATALAAKATAQCIIDELAAL